LIVTMDLVQLNDPGRKETPPRLREDRGRRHPRVTAANEFGAAIVTLGITQRRVAELFGTSPRHVRRWQSGARRVPRGVAIVLNLLTTGTVTIEQVAAASTPAKTNGRAKAALPASLVEPTPEPRAEAATVADLNLSTAAKVYAVTGCRFPIGDPRWPGFCFCNGPVAKGAYCEAHYRLAHMVIERKPSPPFCLRMRTALTTRKLAIAV
jgi:hypothetical protein